MTNILRPLRPCRRIVWLVRAIKFLGICQMISSGLSKKLPDILRLWGEKLLKVCQHYCQIVGNWFSHDIRNDSSQIILKSSGNLKNGVVVKRCKKESFLKCALRELMEIATANFCCLVLWI